MQQPTDGQVLLYMLSFNKLGLLGEKARKGGSGFTRCHTMFCYNPNLSDQKICADNIFTLRQWCSNNFPEAKEQLENMYKEVSFLCLIYAKR